MENSSKRYTNLTLSLQSLFGSVSSGLLNHPETKGIDAEPEKWQYLNPWQLAWPGKPFYLWGSETTYSHWKKPGVNSKDSTKTTGLGSYIIPKVLKPHLLKNTRKLEGTHKRITIQEIPIPASTLLP